MDDWLTVTEVGPSDKLVIYLGDVDETDSRHFRQTFDGNRVVFIGGSAHIFVVREAES